MDDARGGRLQVEDEEAGGGGGAAGDDGEALIHRGGDRVLEAGVLGREVEVARLALAVDEDDAGEPLALADRDDAPGGEDGEHAHALAPGGGPVFAVARSEGATLTGGEVVPVEVAPAGGVGDVVEGIAIGGEGRLEDGLLRSAGHHLGGGDGREGAFREGELGDAQLGAVPGHVRVVPLDPGEAVTSGTPGGLHVEVAAARELSGPELPGRVGDGDDILVLVRMHVGDPAPGGADGGGGGLAERGRDGECGATVGAVEGLAVDALAVVVDEPALTIRQGVVAAAVADAGAHKDVAADVAEGGIVAAHGGGYGHAAVAASLEPAEGATIAVPGRPAQADAARKGAGRDGALPGSIGAALGHAGHSARCGGWR